MKTAMQELIDWTLRNAVNLTDQAGNSIISIDHEEMREHFDKWLADEKSNIRDAYEAGKYNGSGTGSISDLELSGDEYFNLTFNPSV